MRLGKRELLALLAGAFLSCIWVSSAPPAAHGTLTIVSSTWGTRITPYDPELVSATPGFPGDGVCVPALKRSRSRGS